MVFTCGFGFPLALLLCAPQGLPELWLGPWEATGRRDGHSSRGMNEGEKPSIVVVHSSAGVDVLHDAARELSQSPGRSAERRFESFVAANKLTVVVGMRMAGPGMGAGRVRREERENRGWSGSGRPASARSARVGPGSAGRRRRAWGAGPGDGGKRPATASPGRRRRGGEAREEVWEARRRLTYAKRMAGFDEELERERRKRERKAAARQVDAVDHVLVLREGNEAIGEAIDGLLAHKEAVAQRRREIVHARWTESVYRPIQARVKSVIDSPAFAEYEAQRRVEADKYVHCTKPPALDGPTIYDADYDPFALPTLKIATADLDDADPTIAAIRPDSAALPPRLRSHARPATRGAHSPHRHRHSRPRSADWTRLLVSAQAEATWFGQPDVDGLEQL